jgi:outer membrane protein OmpA-like peptidoglycan-associated protein
MMKMYMGLGASLLVFSLLTGCAAPGGPDVSINQTSRGVEISSTDSILFDSGKYAIKPSGRVFLDRIAVMLRTRTSNNIVIEGHTDSVGSAAFNQELSEMRALSVKKALIDRGVYKNRIRAEGYGASRPVSANSSEAGRRLNRRTDIIILGEKKENLSGGGLLQNVLDFSKNLFN